MCRFRRPKIPYAALQPGSAAFAPAGPECFTSRLEMNRAGTVEIASGIQGFRLLRLGGSAFHGFVRDEYTTLAGHQEPAAAHGAGSRMDLHVDAGAAFSGGKIPATVRAMVHQVFEGFESGSIQEVIYQIGTKMLAEIPAIAEVHLEARKPHLGYGGRARRGTGDLHRSAPALWLSGPALAR